MDRFSIFKNGYAIGDHARGRTSMQAQIYDLKTSEIVNQISSIRDQVFEFASPCSNGRLLVMNIQTTAG